MTEKIDFETPITNIRRLTQQDDSDEFYIIIKTNSEEKEEVVIKTTKNKARVISNKINQIHQTDPTIDTYEIIIPYISTNKNKTPINIDTFSKQIKSLLHSTQEKVEIPKDEKIIFNIAQNVIEFYTYNDKSNQVIENNEDAISLLGTELHSASVEYLSSHFLENVENGNIYQLSAEIVEDIIDSYFSENDEEETEDERQRIFEKLSENDENEDIAMHFLLSMRCSEYSASMKEYMSHHLSSEVVSNELGRIIDHFKEQLLSSESKNLFDEKKKETSCEFHGNELSGIITHLKKEFGNDLPKEDVLKLTSIPTERTHGTVNNLIKYDSNSINESYENDISRSAAKENGWIEFDFYQRKINVTSYTIRTDSSLYAYPKTWKIVGSNDAENWDVIDCRTDDQSLKRSNTQHRFECENSAPKKYYRYIRYMQESTWIRNYSYNITLSCIEFFGSILS